MKPASSSLIVTFSFLLWFSLTTTKPSSFASAAEPVIDIGGDPLVAGQEYYIVSSLWGAEGGGVRRERTNESSCSYSVILDGSFNFHADPTVLSVGGKFTGTIYDGSSEVEILFVYKPGCSESSKWVVAVESGSPSLSSAKLVVGGPADYPNSILERGVFRIEKFSEFFPNTYKLVFCPKKQPRSSGSCYNVGLGEGRQLVLDNDGFPFTLIFVKGGFSGNAKSTI